MTALADRITLWLAMAAMALIASCGGRYRLASDYPVKIGRPYTVRGITCIPAPAPSYDAVGYASWYGSESGNRTAMANGSGPRRSAAPIPPCPYRAMSR